MIEQERECEVEYVSRFADDMVDVEDALFFKYAPNVSATTYV